MISSENKKQEKESIDRLFIFLMEQFVRSYRQLANQTLLEHDAGIHVDEWVVLKRISEARGCSQIELAEFTVKGPAKMTRTLDSLGEKGLVEKHQSPEDRRRYMVFTTKAGQQLIDRLMPAVHHNREKALNGFSELERKQLQHLLVRMVGNLD